MAGLMAGRFLIQNIPFINNDLYNIVAEGVTHAPNSLPCQGQPPRGGGETPRKSDAHWKSALFAWPEVIPEAVDLMPALMQDGHTSDVAIQ